MRNVFTRVFCPTISSLLLKSIILSGPIHCIIKGSFDPPMGVFGVILYCFFTQYAIKGDLIDVVKVGFLIVYWSIFLLIIPNFRNVIFNDVFRRNCS